MTGALLRRGTQTQIAPAAAGRDAKLNARITVTGGAARATATIGTTEANLVPAHAPGRRNAARARLS